MRRLPGVSMKRLLAAAAVAVSVLLVAGCGVLSSSPEETPFTSLEASTWFDDNEAFSDCPFPDLIDTACKATAQLRSQDVTLEPGMVIEQYPYASPSDVSPPPIKRVEVKVAQKVWCFVVRDYERWESDSYSDGGERVSYSYPCFALGPDLNEELSFLVGYLEPDGSLSQSRREVCRHKFPGDSNWDNYNTCWEASTTADILTEEPTW